MGIQAIYDKGANYAEKEKVDKEKLLFGDDTVFRSAVTGADAYHHADF